MCGGRYSCTWLDLFHKLGSAVELPHWSGAITTHHGEAPLVLACSFVFGMSFRRRGAEVGFGRFGSVWWLEWEIQPSGNNRGVFG